MKLDLQEGVVVNNGRCRVFVKACLMSVITIKEVCSDRCCKMELAITKCQGTGRMRVLVLKAFYKPRHGFVTKQTSL